MHSTYLLELVSNAECEREAALTHWNTSVYLLYSLSDGAHKTNSGRPAVCFSPPSDNLCNGKFHKHLQDLYAPLVVRYVDLMESSIAQSIHRGFERETWEPVK